MRSCHWASFCAAGKNSDQIELFELGTAGIHVAEYLTVLPPHAVLRDKLHSAIETARARSEAKAQPRLQRNYECAGSG
jgi:hypothetical protein